MLTPQRIEAFRRRSVSSTMPFFIKSLRAAQAKGYEKFLPLEFVEDRCTLERVKSSKAYSDVIDLIRANKMVPFILTAEDGRCWLAIRRPDYEEPTESVELQVKKGQAGKRVIALALLIALGISGWSVFLNTRTEVTPSPSQVEQRE